jgi:hypothetical protein
MNTSLRLPYEAPDVELVVLQTEEMIAQSVNPSFNGFNNEVVW